MFSFHWHRTLLVLALLASTSITGQTTLIIERIPADTPAGDGIYMSGNFENWSGGQEDYKLKESGQIYLIELPAVEQDILFKFTRGDWNTVEVDADGSSIANRELSLQKQKDTIRLEIEAWGDFTAKTSTASANVKVLSESFDMGTLQKKRNIWIYLPENYKDTEKKYPVLYMQDGQNLFDKATSYTGEWEVDETLDRLSASDGLELIVVGIDHGGQDRIDEYSPYKLKSYESKVQGHNYVKFISEELKPFVDANYRSLPERENTGIMGSSLGGLISFYAAMEFDQVFGFAGVFSPSFELIDPSIARDDIAKPLTNTRIYLMCGDQESGNMAPEMKKMTEQLVASGFDPANIRSEVIKGGKHNEELWKNEFESAVRWLLTKEQ